MLNPREGGGGERGVLQKPIFYKDNRRLNWNFHKDEGVRNKKPFRRRYGYFLEQLSFAYHVLEEVTD